MKKCEECGKRLGVLNGYQHPILGKKYSLCSPCFDKVEKSLAKWREFVCANSFNFETSNIDLKLNLKRVLEGVGQVGKLFRKSLVLKDEPRKLL